MKKLKSVFSKLTEFVIITDENGITEWVNPAFYKITKWLPEDIIGHKPGDVLQGPKTNQDIKQQMHNAIENKQEISTIVLNYDKNGEEMYFNINIIPFKDDDGKEYFIGFQNNLTNYYQQMDNLQILKNLIQEELRIKTDILEILSHDLKNDLGSVISFNDFMLSHLQDMSIEEIKEMYSEINVKYRKMYNLVQNLLISSRSINNEELVKPIWVKREIKQILEKQINLKDLEIHNNLDSTFLLEMIPLHFEIILNNFLTNAFKYTNEHGTIWISNQGNKLEISNTHFYKISEKDLDNLNHFKNMHLTKGYGLFICRSLLKKYNSSFTISSTNDKTTIIIKFNNKWA